MIQREMKVVSLAATMASEMPGFGALLCFAGLYYWGSSDSSTERGNLLDVQSFIS